MSGQWFRPNFYVESFLSSIVQESHINHRSEQSGDHFHEWAMISSKISCREFLKIYGTKEPHQSEKWAIWRPFSWVGDDFVQFFKSRVSWDLEYKRATLITEVSYLETIFKSGRWFRPSFHVETIFRSLVQKSHINHRGELSGDHFHEWAMISTKLSWREFLEIYKTEEPHQSQKWAIWRPFSWVGVNFVQIFVSRVSWDLEYKRATSITEVIYLGTIFMSGRWFRPKFHVANFLRSIVQKSHINHRSELSGDHFHEWAMISSKLSWRQFLEIYKTEEPINHRSELSGDHFHEWALISFKFSCREFLEI